MNNFDLFFLLSFILFAGLFYFNYQQIQVNNNVLRRIADIHDMEDLSVLGHGGLFDTGSQNILVYTRDRSEKEVCMTFLHEMGHMIDFRAGTLGPKTEEEREIFANEYRNVNAWRCEGL